VTKSRAWHNDGFHYGAKLTAVTSGSAENKEFFVATPQGTLEVTTIVDAVFEPGKEYFIDITEAPPR
jgi:hypothetical protein